jgi:hypothetical protein
MLVKKELNQKKMELDVIQREHKVVLERIKNSEQIKDSKFIDEFNKTGKNLSKIREELDELTKKQKGVKDEIVKEQSNLHGIKKQQIESEKELDEANSRLYNANEELEKKENFQDTSIFTPKEKEFIEGSKINQKSSAGIIEAASAVVGSLKIKTQYDTKGIRSTSITFRKRKRRT